MGATQEFRRVLDELPDLFSEAGPPLGSVRLNYQRSVLHAGVRSFSVDPVAFALTLTRRSMLDSCDSIDRFFPGGTILAPHSDTRRSNALTRRGTSSLRTTSC